MKILQNGDERVAKIIKKEEIDEAALYRPFRYLYASPAHTGNLLMNTLSGVILQLTEEEWQAFGEIQKNGIMGSELILHPLKLLASLRFLVTDSTEEYKLYTQVRAVLRSMEPKKVPGIQQYTIFPTTGCNARCIYCFEEDIPVRTMTPDTADQVADYICRTRANNTVKLVWFGGEPLVARTIIDRICRRLSDLAVPYTSEIITNAVLMTKDLAAHARDLWHVRRVQVSVDGARADYEYRKAFVAPQLHNYDTLFDAIGVLLGEDFEVILRCNYDRGNLDGMKSFLDDVRSRFQNSDKLYLYFGMLYQEQLTDECMETYGKMLDLQRYLDATGMHYKKPPT